MAGGIPVAHFADIHCHINGGHEREFELCKVILDLLLGPFSLRDILHQADKCRLAIVGHATSAQRHLGCYSVAAHDAKFDIEIQNLFTEKPTHSVRELATVGLDDPRYRIGTDHCVWRVLADNLGTARIHIGKDAFLNNVDPDDSLFGQGPKSFIRCAPPMLCNATLGNVADGALRYPDPRTFVAMADEFNFDPCTCFCLEQNV